MLCFTGVKKMPKKIQSLVCRRKVCYFGITDLPETDQTRTLVITSTKEKNNVRRNKEKRVEEADIQRGN